MALNIPNQYISGPGGPLVNALSGITALTKQGADSQYAQEKARYAPYTLDAEARSKLAYANLMGPQFVAKLLGHPDVVANSPQLQDSSTTNRLYQAGMGQGGGQQNQNAFNLLPPRKSMFEMLYDKLSGNNGSGQTSQQQPPQAQYQQQPALPQSMNANALATPSQPSQVPGEAMPNNNPMNNMPASQPSYGPSGGGNGNALIQPTASAMPNSAPISYVQPNATYAENAANFADIKAEGKELGTERAKNIVKLDDEYETGLNMQTSIDKVIQDAQNPVFKDLRSKIPLFQDKQLNVLSKIGTPEQQQVIGNFIGSAKKMQADTIKGFGSRVLATEFPFTDKMKISENDTWNTMIGKLSAASYFNQYSTQRVRLASELMQKQHLNKGEALQAADRQLNGNKIREQVEDKITPYWTITNQKTGERITLPAAEARKKMKAK